MTDDTTLLLERLAETFPDRPAPLPELVAAAHAGRRRRTRRNVALAGVVLAGGGLALQIVLPGGDGARSVDRVADPVPEQACDKGNPVPPKEPIPAGPNYLTNAAGETYGSWTGGSPQPDLLAAIGDCGRTGYIRRSELDEPPWVPGAGSGDLLSTPVFEADGVTQIDTFTQDEGISGPGGAGGSPPSSFEPPTGPDAAAVQGTWTAVIVASTKHDTFRDLDLAITFEGQDLLVDDGCRTWTAAFTLVAGELALTTPLNTEDRTACTRAAPLPQVLDNVRYVTQSGQRTYLHLANFQIAVSLTRA